MHLFSRARSLRSRLLVVALLLQVPTSYATCYYPNGDKSSVYQRCPDSLSCCLKGESCLSNGLCFTANFGILYRGLCADTSWPIAECPRACYTEIPDGWANLFQCNSSQTAMTCSHEISAAVACTPSKALGTYEYTTANVTVAQLGIQDLNTSTTVANSTSTNSSAAATTLATVDPAASASPTCPPSSSSTNSELIAIGAGLGAGLGVPLLIATALVIYCGGQKRRLQQQQEQSQQQLPVQFQHNQASGQSAAAPKRWTGTAWRPIEMGGSLYDKPGHFELGGAAKGRAELPGA